MKTAYSMQIWTNRNIIRDWFVAENADDAFNQAYNKYPDVSRMAVNHFVPYEQFPHFKCSIAGDVSRYDIIEYGDTNRGYLWSRSDGAENDIENIARFLEWAANRGADIKAF